MAKTEFQEFQKWWKREFRKQASETEFRGTMSTTPAGPWQPRRETPLPSASAWCLRNPSPLPQQS